MIKETIYIKEYDWCVIFYFAVDCYYTYEILNTMRTLGADKNTLLRAHKSLTSGILDTGLCYSNKHNRTSVVVTSVTSTAEEFFNSVVHEIHHLATHISKAEDIDLESEEPCYLAGNVARRIFNSCHKLLCKRCRKHLYRHTA